MARSGQVGIGAAGVASSLFRNAGVKEGVFVQHWKIVRFIPVGLDQQCTIKLACKLHAHSVMYANKLATARRAIKNILLTARPELSMHMGFQGTLNLEGLESISDWEWVRKIQMYLVLPLPEPAKQYCRRGCHLAQRYGYHSISQVVIFEASLVLGNLRVTRVTRGKKASVKTFDC
eukprot:1151380-Pelagomonas_calceolata.AAC.3